MTLWHLSRAIAETAWISAPTVIESALGRVRADVCDTRLDSWSRRLLQQARIEIEVHGLDLAPADETFVVMSNHQSLYDIPVVFQALDRRVRMVAKTELFKVPVWAPAMRAAGFVEVDRKNRERAIESLARAKDALAHGTSIWIAPEGTRSRSGALGPFKQGGFHLALDAGCRILPITIVGTREVLRAKGFKVRPGALVDVWVNEPVDPSEYGHERRAELCEEVRRRITARLPDYAQSEAS